MVTGSRTAAVDDRATLNTRPKWRRLDAAFTRVEGHAAAIIRECRLDYAVLVATDRLCKDSLGCPAMPAHLIGQTPPSMRPSCCPKTAGSGTPRDRRRRDATVSTHHVQCSGWDHDGEANVLTVNDVDPGSLTWDGTPVWSNSSGVPSHHGSDCAFVLLPCRRATLPAGLFAPGQRLPCVAWQRLSSSSGAAQDSTGGSR